MSALMQESLATRFDRDGFAALDSLTTAEDIARVRSLLDPLFDSFNSLGERAFDLAGPLAAGAFSMENGLDGLRRMDLVRGRHRVQGCRDQREQISRQRLHLTTRREFAPRRIVRKRHILFPLQGSLPTDYHITKGADG